MPKDIKKKSASHIYYGVDKDSGKLKHISQVPSGMKCNCKCARCGESFEARKGTQRRHHFAHVSNYECMYAGEVAVYLGFANALKKLEKIYLPAITIQFPTWSEPEVIQEGRLIAIDHVLYECKEGAYPPWLRISVGESLLRIILEFGNYYNDPDIKLLKKEASSGGYSTLMYYMPSINEDDFSTNNLIDIIRTGSRAEWILSQLRDRQEKKYYQIAKEPESCGNIHSCPISINMYNGKYSATNVDCMRCEYNIAKPPRCLCTAEAGIRHISDFKRDAGACKADIEKTRMRNEERTKHRMTSRNAQGAKGCFNGSPKSKHSAPHTRSNSPTPEELEGEYQRILLSFDPTSRKWTVDKYGRRWIKCKVCGELKESSQMACYGGSDGVNRGTCSECNRKSSSK